MTTDKTCPGCGGDVSMSGDVHAAGCPVFDAQIAAARRAGPRQWGPGMRESSQGLKRADYDPARDVTHVCIPVRVTGNTADEAVAAAVDLALAVEAVVDETPAATWITTHEEAAYALIANLVTSLQQLDLSSRAAVIAAAPGVRDLRSLLLVWVTDHEGEPRPVSGPMDADTVRVATAADLARIVERFYDVSSS